MRFLHLADIHLDTPFAGRAAGVRRRLRESVREAFRRAVDLTLDEELDAVVIAGDLFDGDLLSFETERFLLTQLQRLTERGVTVVYATGNHDPGTDPGRRGAIEWPRGVHVADGPTALRVLVHDRRGQAAGYVTAVGHATASESDDLTPRFPRPEGMLPEVAVLHTQVGSSQGADDHGRYAPTTLAALRATGFDYWALGHVHRRQELETEPAIHYPGNIQGRTPAESGPRGGLLVTLDGAGTAQVEFRSLGPIRWETVEVDGLATTESLDALTRTIARRWEDQLADDPGTAADWMIRVRLVGGSPLWRQLRSVAERETLEAELTGELGAVDVVVQVDALHPPFDPRTHRDRDDALGWGLRALEALLNGDGSLEGLETGLQGWDPRQEDLQTYLRRTLEGADADLASRMLRSS